MNSYLPAQSVLSLMVLLLCSMYAVADTPSPIQYEKSSHGTSLLKSKSGGSIIKILVEEANLGSGEIEIGEITLPAGLVSSDHTHGSIEFFYVLSGRMEHIVNGESSLLTPGMIGIVRPGDNVTHKIPDDAPCKALVIWTPGGELEQLKQFFDAHPVQ